MIDLRKSKDDSTIELDLADQIKEKLTEGWNAQTIIIAFVKVAIICISPALLKVYEIRIHNQLNGDLSQLRAELQVKQSEVKKIEDELKAYSKSKDQKVQFDDTMKILTKLAEDRLQVIEVLDSLQTSVHTASSREGDNPNRYMVFDSIRVNKNNVDISAVASSEMVINKFLEALDNENIYKTVHLGQVSDDRAGGSLKKFSVKGVIAQKESL